MSSPSLKQQSINPPGTEPVANIYRLSQAMRVGNTIWVSGQVGADAAMTVAEGMEAQTRLAFENLKTVVEAAGAALADIVELTILYTDIDERDIDAFLRVKDEYITVPYPAITGFGVAKLAIPGLLLEIRAVAVAGSGDV